MENKQLYFDLFNMPGISGGEHFVRDYVKKELEKYSDELIMDKLGSIFGVKKGPEGAPVVMVAGHMDEVGAMVVGFKDNGLIKMKAIGGVSGKTFSSQLMDLYTDEGAVIPGVTGKTEDDFDKLHLDIGADNKEHAVEMGVQIGDMIVPRTKAIETHDGKKIISKAVDDRWGCGMAIELLKDLQGETLNCTLVVGCTVQEEVGLRGAKTASQMVNPDIFFALDVSPCGDVVGPPLEYGELGAGFLFRFMDRGTILHKGMKKLLKDTAGENDIKFQYFRSLGGTDASAAQVSHGGIPATTIGINARYIHSTVSMFHKDDHEAAKAILRALVKKIDSKVVEEVRNNA